MPPLPEELGGAPKPDHRQWVVIPIENMFSDGNPGVWPTDPSYEDEAPAKYLEKLAKMWVQHTGEYQKGKNYTFNQLPSGYKLVAKARQQPSSIVRRDKFLAGHPSGVLFNSIPKFFEHFVHLMQSGTTTCSCDLCKPTGRKAMASDKAKQPAKTSKRERQQEPAYLATDEEGTQDMFKELVYELSIRKKFTTLVEEYNSMDWRAERNHLGEHLGRISMQHSFIPRVGELVVWCWDLKGEILYDEKQGKFQVYCLETGRNIGTPEWRAGIVTQVPEEPPVLADAFFKANTSELAINRSGFRIETYPNPNDSDKSLSSQYRYVPLSHIRPFNMWEILHQGIPTDQFHPSIWYGLVIMASLSLLKKTLFEGVWPNAQIYADAIYLGAELLVRGDTVRMMPHDTDVLKVNPFDSVKEVLVITHISLHLENCDADLNSPCLAQRICPRLTGQAYTTSPERAYRDPSAPNEAPKPLTRDEVIEAFQNVGMLQYGPWYRYNPSDGDTTITPNLVIGRCYESFYMQLRFHSLLLGLDTQGVINGREFSRENDARLWEGQEFFAGDYRLETLDVETFNGIAVGKHDEGRDLKMWRASLRIIDGTATAGDLSDANNLNDQGRQRGSDEDIIGGQADSSQFRNMETTSSMVSTALAPTESSNNVASAFGTPFYYTPTNYEDEFGKEMGGKGTGKKSSVGDHRKSSALSEQSEDSLNQLLQMPPTVAHDYNEQIETGDFMPSFPESIPKRRKH